mgnify:CR=1 FL=1
MDIQQLIDQYTTWIKNEIKFDKIGEYYEITTPYLDNANDYLQIYVKQIGDNICFTDDGAVINNLKMNGIQFTCNRKEHLNAILLQYGVQLRGNEIIAETSFDNFAQKKHLFIQAMLRIDDMFATSKSKVSSFFLDDIQNFFLEREIYHSENVQFIGVSGLSHNYDFLFQRNKKNPERLCQAVNTPNQSNVGNVIFSWNDTKSARKTDSQLIVILNDQNKIKNKIKEAFFKYDIRVILWSERNRPENLELFSA